MNNADEPQRFYTLLQRRLHWLVIVLVAAQYLLQDVMRESLRIIEAGDALGFGQFLATTWHTWGGLSIAAIMLWRWRLRQRSVPLNGGHLSHRHQQLVKIHHVSLYVVIIAMAASGALTYYLGWQQAQRVHEFLGWCLLLLISLHIAGALWHARRHGNVLFRMMGRNSLR